MPIRISPTNSTRAILGYWLKCTCWCQSRDRGIIRGRILQRHPVLEQPCLLGPQRLTQKLADQPPTVWNGQHLAPILEEVMDRLLRAEDLPMNEHKMHHSPLFAHLTLRVRRCWKPQERRLSGVGSRLCSAPPWVPSQSSLVQRFSIPVLVRSFQETIVLSPRFATRGRQKSTVYSSSPCSHPGA